MNSYALHAYARNVNVIIKDLVTEMELLDDQIRQLQQTLRAVDYYSRPGADRRSGERRNGERSDSSPPGIRPVTVDRRLPVAMLRARVQAQLVTATERYAIRDLQRRMVEANRY